MTTLRVRGQELSPAPTQGTVLFVPDVLMSRLLAGGTEVWPSAEAIAGGGLGAIVAGAEVTVGGLVDGSVLDALSAALDGTRRIEPVPFDWRGGSTEDPAAAGGIDHASSALRRRLEARMPEDEPLAVVGHGAGALGVLELLRSADGPELLRDVPLLLAAPPLRGSEALLRLCLGEGRLLDMLRCLDPQSTASDLAGLFLRMRGIVELLPDTILDPDGWMAASLGTPDRTLLAAVAERRSALIETLRAHPRLACLLGTAETTPTTTLGERRRIEARDDGDGWMLNPLEDLPRERTWFAAALHERVLLHPLAAAAAADLLRTGTTTRLMRQAPATRPRRDPPPFVFPTQADLEGELRAADAGGEPAAEQTIQARVAHGSLDRLARPLLIGHYAGDAIIGAEAFLDRCLRGRLRHRLELGTYPGPAGTAAFVPASGCSPTGAMVLGLGDVGELTAGVLSKGVELAVLEGALHHVEQRRGHAPPAAGPVVMPVASLLIGTRGGGQLSLRQSMVAVLRGVLAARRALASAELDRFVTVDDVTFVELWSDIAIAAGHALRELGEDAGLGRAAGERILAAETVQVLGGGRGNSRAYGDEWAWWRRVIVSEDAGERRRGLKFVTLGERSRAEERLVFTQRELVEELLAGVPGAAAGADDGTLVNALYEALLPVPIKETIFEGRDLVLVVDQESGRYPWELLARRSGDTLEPVVSRVGVMRQFRTQDFREKIAPARSHDALVVGDPVLGGSSSLQALDGARLEAQEVAEMLSNGGLAVEASIRERGAAVFKKFFRRDYRLLHIAAHGLFDPGDPDRTGVVVGQDEKGRFSVLSGAVFRQLPKVPEVVFLNCCHLGKLDGGDAPLRSAIASDADRSRLAASVAQAVMSLGVRCLVVAGWAVDDRAARDFAREFYTRLLAGEPFGSAVHEARCVVWKRHPHTTTWGAYQCYGDPSFRLRASPGRGRPEPRFVSAEELDDSVKDITAAATAIGTSKQYLESQAEELRAIEGFLDRLPEWKTGVLLYDLAEAWKALGDKEKAVTHYRDALAAEDARAPIRAAEQLSNLLDRLRQEGRTVNPRFRLPVEGTRDVSGLADAWLDWVSVLGETPERAALGAGMMKRAAEHEQDPRGRRNRLRDAAKWYQRGLKFALEQGRPFLYYQGLNAAMLLWVIGEADAKTITDLVAPSRIAAEAERAGGRTLWNTTAACDADLLEALIGERLDEATANELRDRYSEILTTLGTPTEHDSARKAIELLVACAVDDRAHLRPFLETIRSAFP